MLPLFFKFFFRVGVSFIDSQVSGFLARWPLVDSLLSRQILTSFLTSDFYYPWVTLAVTQYDGDSTGLPSEAYLGQSMRGICPGRYAKDGDA